MRRATPRFHRTVFPVFVATYSAVQTLSALKYRRAVSRRHARDADPRHPDTGALPVIFPG
jgi:hypothetical protein